MVHDKAEDPEEEEEQSQTEEHDAHGEQRDADAVRVLALQFGILCLIGLDEVLNAGSDVVSRLHAPLVAVTGIALVCSEGWYGDRVDEFLGVAVIESDPDGFRHGNLQREVQLTLGGIGVAEEYQVLPATNLRTRVTAGDNAHALDAFRHTHFRIENAAVGSKIHATDVVGGE